LGCCISYTDETKETTLNSKTGQTALYWIIMNTPDNVSHFIYTKMQLSILLKKIGTRSFRSIA
jgi:hypothetical protein